MYSIRTGLVAAAFSGVALIADARRPTAAPLVVHEWGTITTIHSMNGTAQSCLNRISGSDALPDFVHRFEPGGLTPPTGNAALARVGARTVRIPLVKSPLADCRRDVTMRLETPVIYFHPAAGARSIPPFDVNVHFRGGVLNEFYPNANASVTVDADQPWDGATIGNTVVGELHWRGLSLHDSLAIPATDAHVWLAPRAAQSASVATTKGEAERYLFYRGVAHLDAVIGTQRAGTNVRLLAPASMDWMRTSSAEVAGAWLFDIRPNGLAAFRSVGALKLDRAAPGATVATVPLFTDDAYRSDGVEQLRATMKRSLVSAGLNDDEAAAMLDTWSDSYFRTPGLRVFYLVPRAWTDYYLPLDISVPSTITRVIVGRIDLTGF